MEMNPLFYKSVTPLNREKHRDLRMLDSVDRYGFAMTTHVIPAVVDEFASALSHLPIVFAPSKPHPTPVFLVGVRPSRNLLVNDGGRWLGDYIPAFVRRYPFIRGEVDGSAPVTCVDEKSELLGAAVGERLFDDDGKESPLLRKTIELLDQYYISAKRTEVFLSIVNDLQLLRYVTIETNVGQGSSSVIHGFMTIDEEKLNALDPVDFLRLRDGGFLVPIYAHLFSLRSVDVLRKAIQDLSTTDEVGDELEELNAEDGGVALKRESGSKSSPRPAGTIS